ncbi:Protein N-acetyltransferase, RimJ/RimL family [Psychrobacillus sp. OK028]|uniref:GNAT family N-acetyltransferase n=1 Tax=Psychrobacillus sp. OK028 TaxID=1884359 RepID=UPI0008808F1C|nr:GNAT family protein [Psychrobacillus sp. OK028]SDM89390.1 Protein N-acetyltransferase, RimJ/RimL family [Psychrobacillus sp. OK028]
MEFSKLTIETERFIIRPFKKTDYNNWYDQFDHRMPSQYKYDDGRPRDMSTSTEEWFVDWIEGFNELAKNDEMYILGIFRKEDGVNVGKVELITILRMDYQWAMMGYSIHNQYWKQGYGLESVLAATEAFFSYLNFHRIELHINTDNYPSIRLAKKAGFIFECKRKEFSLENDTWTDYLIYYRNHHK